MTSRPDGSSYKCLRLPADGSAPTRVTYTITTTKHEGPDVYLDTRPDLRPYWSVPYISRKMQALNIENNAIPALDGEYLLYYSVESSLPVNNTILAGPTLHKAVEATILGGVKFTDRVFYRGDMFVVRMCEHWDRSGFKAQWEDVSESIVSPLIKVLDEMIFPRNWQVEFLDKNVVSDAYLDQHNKKYKEAKALLMEAIPPADRNLDARTKFLVEMMAAISAGASKNQS